MSPLKAPKIEIPSLKLHLEMFINTHKLAPKIPERPARQNIVGSRKRYTKHHKQQIRHSQIYDENVCG